MIDNVSVMWIKPGELVFLQSAQLEPRDVTEPFAVHSLSRDVIQGIDEVKNVSGRPLVWIYVPPSVVHLPTAIY